ncbi:hypothetical protein ACFSQT_29425 [Mesorhizobium calcicola]|uniref:Uncharacterized protein n=1 Tax=Mesorhizobium calcicola TaxID=1300310 RepID=A0ABW4WN69_9HYPH
MSHHTKPRAPSKKTFFHFDLCGSETKGDPLSKKARRATSLGGGFEVSAA